MKLWLCAPARSFGEFRRRLCRLFLYLKEAEIEVEGADQADVTAWEQRTVSICFEFGRCSSWLDLFIYVFEQMLVAGCPRPAREHDGWLLPRSP